MKIDIQDVLFWMDAIRNSDDSYRTLESFWKGQVNSKLWLVEQLALARRTEYTQHTITQPFVQAQPHPHQFHTH